MALAVLIGRIGRWDSRGEFFIARPRRFGKSLAVSAIRQIKANHYADKFAGNGKTLTLIGLAFSKAKRTIVATKVEEVA